MANPKQGSRNEKPIHYSVGALVKNDDKFLLIYRAKTPICYAGVAGHVDEGEGPLQAIHREVKEESGLEIKECHLLFEEMVDWNWCRRGITGHYWYLYECAVAGDVMYNKAEVKSIGWYSIGEIKQMDIEPVWKYWFEKSKLL